MFSKKNTNVINHSTLTVKYVLCIFSIYDGVTKANHDHFSIQLYILLCHDQNVGWMSALLLYTKTLKTTISL